MTGKFRLAWQRGNRALYAEVSLACEWGEVLGCCVQIPPSVPDTWKAAVRFGAEVFAANALASESSARGLIVEVSSLLGQPVDTTVEAVAYVTFRALGDAMGRNDCDAFMFDEESGHFILRAREA
jgi:hypothetical protein